MKKHNQVKTTDKELRPTDPVDEANWGDIKVPAPEAGTSDRTRRAKPVQAKAAGPELPLITPTNPAAPTLKQVPPAQMDKQKPAAGQGSSKKNRPTSNQTLKNKNNRSGVRPNRKSRTAKPTKSSHSTKSDRGSKYDANNALLLFAVLAVSFRLLWPPLAYAVNFFSRLPIAGYTIGQSIRLLTLYLLPLLLLRTGLNKQWPRLAGRGKTNLHTVLQTAITGVIAAVFLRGLHNLSVFLLTQPGFLVLDRVIPPYPTFSSPAAFFACFLIQVPAAAILETLVFVNLLPTEQAAPARSRTHLLALSTLAALGSPYGLSAMVPFLLTLMTLRLRLIYDDLKVALAFNLSVRTILLLMQFIVPRFDSNYIFLELTGSRVSLWVSLLFVIIGGPALYLNWTDAEKHAPKGGKMRRNLRKKQALHPAGERWSLQSLEAVLSTLPGTWYVSFIILLVGLFLSRILTN